MVDLIKPTVICFAHVNSIVEGLSRPRGTISQGMITINRSGVETLTHFMQSYLAVFTDRLLQFRLPQLVEGKQIISILPLKSVCRKLNCLRVIPLRTLIK